MRLKVQTYALTAVSYQRRSLFQRSAHAELLVATLFRYRDQGKYCLHGFVVMPDHLHVLLSPESAIEKAAQLIKGGFSFVVRQQFAGEVWQDGYHAHRVVDASDYANQLRYIAANPAKRGLADHAYVHTCCSERMDAAPEWVVRGPGG